MCSLPAFEPKPEEDEARQALVRHREEEEPQVGRRRRRGVEAEAAQDRVARAKRRRVDDGGAREAHPRARAPSVDGERRRAALGKASKRGPACAGHRCRRRSCGEERATSLGTTNEWLVASWR